MGWFALGSFALGGIFSAFGVASENAEARRKYEQQKKAIEADYLRALEEFELNWTNEKKEQQDKSLEEQHLADISDKGLDVSERSLSNDFNSEIDNLYNAAYADTFNWNDAAMQADQQKGNALAQAAASGVRAGSSMSQSIELQSATNAAQLQFQQDAQRSSYDNALNKMINGLAQGKVDIWQNREVTDVKRDNAIELFNSYEEGGAAWNVYDMKKRHMAEQKDQAINQLKEDLDSYTGNSFGRWLSGAFGMGSSLFSTGSSIAQSINWGKTYNGYFGDTAKKSAAGAGAAGAAGTKLG